MNKKILVSVFVVLLVIAASIGATMAWFTDQSDEIENVFTAGSVIINADEEWFYEDSALTNWNPGDCTPKFISIEYEGTKRAFLRMKIEKGWEVEEGENPLDSDNVNWLVYVGSYELDDYLVKPGGDDPWYWNYPAGYDSFKDWTNDTNEWVEFDPDNDTDWKYYESNGEGWYYYLGGTNTEFQTVIDGVTINSIQEDDDIWGNPIYLVNTVCLDGPDTGNEYQGKIYSMSFTFQAIQASHEDEWTWDNVDFETGLVVTP